MSIRFNLHQDGGRLALPDDCAGPGGPEGGRKLLQNDENRNGLPPQALPPDKRPGWSCLSM